MGENFQFIAHGLQVCRPLEQGQLRSRLAVPAQDPAAAVLQGIVELTGEQPGQQGRYQQEPPQPTIFHHGLKHLRSSFRNALLYQISIKKGGLFCDFFITEKGAVIAHSPLIFIRL